MKSWVLGILAALILLVLYILILSFVSGWSFALIQFKTYWYFILGLVAGFGIQVGLYTYLKEKISASGGAGVIAVSGTTSAVAMVSCCSHYLVNILPILGVTGLVTLMSQYQIQIFWVGILANLFGISYIGRKVYLVSKLK